MTPRCARCPRFIDPRTGPIGLAHLCPRCRKAEREPTRKPVVDPVTRAFVALVAAQNVGIKPAAEGVARVSGAPLYVARKVMAANGGALEWAE